MQSKRVPILAAAVVAIAGCSGGSGEFPPHPSTPQQPGGSLGPQSCGSAIFDPVPPLRCDSLVMTAPAASVDALPGGYWTGQFLDETQDVQGYMVALVGEDGRFQLQAYRTNETDLCHNWEAMLTGRMTTAGNALRGDGRLIALIPTLADGTRAADLQIDGVVAERDSLTGAWTASSGDAGCFVLEQYWAGDYEAPSALENLAAEWIDPWSPDAARLSVDADGILSGSDRRGCNWTGRFGLIDDRYSLYEFEADLHGCDRASHYTGLAWHGPGWDPGEYWLQLRADDGNRALVVGFSAR